MFMPKVGGIHFAGWFILSGLLPLLLPAEKSRPSYLWAKPCCPPTLMASPPQRSLPPPLFRSEVRRREGKRAIFGNTFCEQMFGGHLPNHHMHDDRAARGQIRQGRFTIRVQTHRCINQSYAIIHLLEHSVADPWEFNNSVRVCRLRPVVHDDELLHVDQVDALGRPYTHEVNSRIWPLCNTKRCEEGSACTPVLSVPKTAEPARCPSISIIIRTAYYICQPSLVTLQISNA